MIMVTTVSCCSMMMETAELRVMENSELQVRVSCCPPPGTLQVRKVR
jgi:hypothetical protein